MAYALHAETYQLSKDEQLSAFLHSRLLGKSDKETLHLSAASTSQMSLTHHILQWLVTKPPFIAFKPSAASSEHSSIRPPRCIIFFNCLSVAMPKIDAALAVYEVPAVSLLSYLIYTA